MVSLFYIKFHTKILIHIFVFGDRNCPTEALAYAEKALEAGAVPGRIRKQLEVQFDANVNSKFLQNLKKKIVGMLFLVTSIEKLLIMEIINFKGSRRTSGQKLPKYWPNMDGLRETSSKCCMTKTMRYT